MFSVRSSSLASARAKVAKQEASPERFLPYSRHIDEHVVVLEGGVLMTVYALTGMPFETADTADLNDWHEKLNGVLKSIADERVSLWAYTVREEIDEYPEGAFVSPFAKGLDERYRQRIAGERLYINRLYLALLMRPSSGTTDQAATMIKRVSSNTAFDGVVAKDHRERFEDKARDLEKLLGRVRPQRLGVYNFNGLSFSAPLEVVQLVMTGRRRRVPLVRGHLGRALYTDRAVFGRETIEIAFDTSTYHMGLFGIREYPAETRPGQLDTLLSAPFSFVLTQSFTFLGKAEASERFRRRGAQLLNTKDAAVSQGVELAEARDDLISNRFVAGEHHLCLAIGSTDPAKLFDRLSTARALLSDAGLVVAREGPALEAAYWSQLPGNFAWRTRPSTITSRNFAALSSLHGYPTGQPTNNHWGPAIALFKTSAVSPYYFNFHVDDLGHTLIIGPSGSGKTVIQNFLMAQLEKARAQQIFIDKDRGAEIFVRATGGSYLTLTNGQPTGFAPLKMLSYEGHDFAFLSRFIRQLVRLPGRGLGALEEKMIDDGLMSLGRVRREDRTFGALRQLLGQRDVEGIGARLERWIKGAPLGWVFDNDVDEIDLHGRCVGFDVTDFLDNGEVRTPILMYIFQRVRGILDGRRLVIDIDEFWKMLEDEAFTAFTQDGLKTYRKQNAFLVFGTQSPADAIRSKISHTIIEQVATKILLPNPRGSVEDYCGGLGLTTAEFNLIRNELSPEQHRFLIKQGHNSVVAELDLTGLGDELAVLSGRASTVNLLDNLRAEVGNDPQDWLPLFQQRRKGLR